MTRKLRLDFQARRATGSPLGWGLLAAGVLLAAGAVADYQSLRDEAAHWEERAMRWESGMARLARGSAADGKRDDSRNLAREAARAAAAVERLGAPWGEFYRAIEVSAADGVALLALQPDLAGRKVVIGGEAKDFPALTAYMQRLARTGVFADVQLVNHEVRRNDPENPLAFTVSALWKVES